jgi:hypothetical protein
LKPWTLDKFVEELRFAVPDTKVSRPYSSETFYELVANLNVQFDLENDVYEINLVWCWSRWRLRTEDVGKGRKVRCAKLRLLCVVI